MSKLIRADFKRLFKSNFFWFASIFMVFTGLSPITSYFSNKKNIVKGIEEIWTIDEGFFDFAIALFFITIIMTTLYVGIEYSSGTIRNKLVVGGKRAHIYLANLITLVTANLIWCGIYIITYLSVGIPLLGTFQSGLSKIVIYVLLSVAMIVALTSVILMISMLCSNKTHSSIIGLMTAVVLMFSAIIINALLEQPEYYEAYSYLNTETGEMVNKESELNTHYVSGTKRVIYEESMDMLSGGQMIQIVGMNVSNPEKIALYDLAILVLTTGLGVFLFRRKDLK